MKHSSSPPNAALFAIPALIWGSTWFAIRFQLVDTVEPLFSIAYRFLIAGALLATFCRFRGISLHFNWQQHRAIMIQALCLFGFNYWFTYQSEQYIASGLVALIFSMIIFLNIGFGRIILGSPIRRQVVIGAVLGLIGTICIFAPGMIKAETNDQTLLGIGLCAAGVVFASLGNIASAFNQRHKLPVVPTTAIGMLYGGGFMFFIALALGHTPTLDTSWQFLTSLIYLSVFGSVVAFSAYLTLIGRIGADRAAYALVIMPVIAIVISMFFEGYQLELIPAFGIGLLLVGNVFALRK